MRNETCTLDMLDMAGGAAVRLKIYKCQGTERTNGGIGTCIDNCTGKFEFCNVTDGDRPHV